MKNLVIKGAREHNLDNIDVTIPRNKFVVITGPSGSGKSTLAFDTIYAEGQRRYVESLSAYARQFLGLMNKPDVDRIDGLSPAISIDQKTTSKNPRSTVGTTTEIYDHLRLLFARVGTPYCPEHGVEIRQRSPQSIAQSIQEEFSEQVTIFAPIISKKKGTYETLLKDLNAEGFRRVRIDGKIQRTDEKASLARYKMHDIDLVIDRLDPSDTSRLTEAVELAVQRSKGIVIVEGTSNGKEGHTNARTYSANMACPVCGLAFEELQPRMFSFNSPFGACETCSGLGIRMEFDPELIVPDEDKSIADGAIAIYRNAVDGWRGRYLGAVARHYGFSILTPIKDLTKKQRKMLFHGSDEPIRFNLSMRGGTRRYSHEDYWEGIIPQSERLYHQTESDYRRRELEEFMRVTECPACHGKRLKPKVLAVKIADHSIIDVTDMSVRSCISFFDNLKLTKKQGEIARQILKEIRSRLRFLDEVGLGYLTLSRSAGTLSGGEAQRIRLATQVGSNLMGVLYILDEPSIGLHQRDNDKLISTLQGLRDLGNTLVVVEHDEDTMRRADHIVDMGPGAGIHGGKIVAQGTPKQIERKRKSITGDYLAGRKVIDVPRTRRSSKRYLHIKGCREHNLKDVDIDVPLGTLTLVTGVSGSGKSTMMYDILYKGLMQKLHRSRSRPGAHRSIKTDTPIDKVIVIDQSPIGKTPRSNPATYTKVFDDIRQIFAQTTEAKKRGFKPGRFSFNVKGGRCENCQGDGEIKIEMNFLPDVYVECEECKGKRYNKETLDVTYKGKNIADVLDMTVEEALHFFSHIPSIKRRLETLKRVGLDYVKLGQSSVTLSGGEAQRIKITRELSKRDTGRTLYLLDEPTTGLHFDDVKKLISVLNALVHKGNTVMVIEHHLDVIKSADHIIDLGPEGGDAGGELVASGTPEEVAKNKKSYTGAFLKRMLNSKGN